jgi:hypothetical protein
MCWSGSWTLRENNFLHRLAGNPSKHLNASHAPPNKLKQTEGQDGPSLIPGGVESPASIKKSRHPRRVPEMEPRWRPTTGRPHQKKEGRGSPVFLMTRLVVFLLAIGVLFAAAVWRLYGSGGRK